MSLMLRLASLSSAEEFLCFVLVSNDVGTAYTCSLL